MGPEGPEKQIVWSYEASVQRASRLYARWKDVTAEFLAEIYDARQKIEASPYTWEDYCRAIGVSRQTILTWLNRFDPDTKTITPPEPEPETEVDVFEPEDTQELGDTAEPEEQAKPKQTSALDYWSLFGPLKQNCQSVSRKLQASMDNNTPLGLAYAVAHIQEFADFLDSWRKEKMTVCQKCSGKGCEYCFNGKSGEFRG